MTDPVPAGFPGLPDDFAIDIAIACEGWPEEGDLTALVETALSAAFQEAPLEAVAGSEVSLVFTDDAAIRELNREWRDKDKPTNVLSFPGSDPDGDLYGPLLGDIVMALETVNREAQELEIDFRAHVTHLVVHGILHLFDYDHQDEEEAELMEGLERRILARLNIADPYEGRPLGAD